MKEATPQTIHIEDYQPPEFNILETKLIFDIGDGETRVESRLSVVRAPHAAPDAPLVLDGHDLELVEVAVDGTALGGNQYRADEDSLTLFGLPDRAEVRIVTRIRPEQNTALEGLYKSGGMYCTQCEAEGFRRITYYPGPAGRAGEVHHHRDCRRSATRCCCPTAIRSRTPSATTDGAGSPGKTRSPSPATCSRWWPAIWRCWRTASSPPRDGR